MADEMQTKRARGRPRSPFTDASGATIQSLDRGLAVLKTLSAADGLALSDLSQRTGLPVSTLHRILLTLDRQGFVRLDEADQHWRVGVEAFRTGSAFLRQTNLMEIGRSVMRDLVDRTGETANMAVPDGHEVVFIGQVETHQPIRAFFRPGTRGAMHASGIGKALLAAMEPDAARLLLARTGLARFTKRTLDTLPALCADLDLTRARGWALDDEERYEGMRCVAACIRDSTGAAVGGISVSGPTPRFDPDAARSVGPTVMEAARRISERLGAAVPEGQENPAPL